ncbi:MAG: YebC/PmpR family DNA-binding transcriptional regulator [Clostridia bacterium]|nr:YebC/PmpR family DNA-binding transcriptional regulator [Clostridia bacterium]
MSGHSKWHNIQARKGKADKARSNVFTKIGREIAMAVKMGGPNPDTNFKLKMVITKAKAANMPNDNIQRSIKKAAGEGDKVNFEEIVYEGFGPAGTAFVVETLTDNRNRTGGEVRHAFDKMGGALGSVSYLFTRKGVIIVQKESYSEEDMMMYALEAGADDLVDEGEVFCIYCNPTELMAVKNALEANGLKVESAELEMVANDMVDPLDKVDSVLKLIDMLEDNDDVQNVYHNAILPEEEEE